MAEEEEEQMPPITTWMGEILRALSLSLSLFDDVGRCLAIETVWTHTERLTD